MDNKDIFARNLKKYMDLSGKSRRDICKDLDFSYYTFSDWVNGKKYPRMDKVEILSKYFGILKSDLIEAQTPERDEEQKKIGTVTDAALRMKNDPDFLSIIKLLLVLDKEKLRDVLNMLIIFLK